MTMDSSNIVRRPSHTSSPLRASPNGSASAAAASKKPFLIGVAGGTASGKVGG